MRIVAVVVTVGGVIGGSQSQSMIVGGVTVVYGRGWTRSQPLS